MKTLKQFENELKEIPASTALLLGDVEEAKRKQESLTKQSLQKLKVLSQEALIESAVSSNRIEGVTVDRNCIQKEAYKEFEQRAGQIKEPRGAKTELIESAVGTLKSGFSVSDLEKSCPTVSRDMIRRVLHDLKKKKKVECLGHGPGARWRQKG